MNYNSKIKITRYNKDTIWLYDSERKTKEILIKVKGNLNIQKPIKIKAIDAKTGEEIEILDM